jgi:predicted nucleic acid-binding protein
MGKTVIVDSDSIFALYNPNDPLNLKATRTFKQLIIQDFKLIYPISVLFEIISLFQRVLPSPLITAKFREMVLNGELITYEINNAILKKSAQVFNPAGSKKNTLIDCSVVVIAKKIKASGVFSYDSFYSKQGLKFAEDLI